MKRAWLWILFFMVACWGLAAGLEPWFQGWVGNRAGSGDLLRIALGDGRKLFARHAYLKADAYFHNGYYPSIFDENEGFDEAHIHSAAGLSREHEKEMDFLGGSLDWIDAFGRHFYPSVHSHLGEADCGHDHHHEGPCEHDHEHDHEEPEPRPAGLEREILPWLRLSVGLDPERVETYATGAYWLRNKLNKAHEAEAFLREGLRANPQSPPLLFELGRIFREDRQDSLRARNVWELAVRNLDQSEINGAEPNIFLRAQLLGNLAKLEEEAGNSTRAIEHLERLLPISPYAASIQRWIEDLREGGHSN